MSDYTQKEKIKPKTQDIRFYKFSQKDFKEYVRAGDWIALQKPAAQENLYDSIPMMILMLKTKENGTSWTKDDILNLELGCFRELCAAYFKRTGLNKENLDFLESE